LQHGDADLKCRLSPSPVGKCRTILHHRLMELAQLGAAPLVGRARYFFAAALRVNVDPARRLPDDSAPAGHDGQAEERLIGAFADRPLFGGAGLAVLGELIDGADETPFRLALIRFADALAAFTDAPGQLGDIEESVAVEHQGRAGSILELEECRVIAFSGEILVRPPGRRPQALDQSAAEEAHDIDLVRALPKADAAADAGVDFRGEPRALQPIIEVPGADLDDGPQPAATHDLADFLNCGAV